MTSSYRIAILLRPRMWQSDKRNINFKKICQSFITKVTLEKKLLTRESYHELSHFSKYFFFPELSHWLKLLQKSQPSKLQAMTAVCPGNLVFWIVLEVLEYRFQSIWCFTSFPHLNGPKCLFSLEEKSLKMQIIEERKKKRKRKVWSNWLLTYFSTFPGKGFK